MFFYVFGLGEYMIIKSRYSQIEQKLNVLEDIRDKWEFKGFDAIMNVSTHMKHLDEAWSVEAKKNGLVNVRI